MALLPIVTSFGDITALNGTIEMPSVGYGTISVVITGTYVATLIPEASFDGGATWAPTNFWSPTTEIKSPYVTLNGSYIAISASGSQRVRVRCSAYTSGTINIVIVGSEVASGPTAVITSVSAPITLIDEATSKITYIGKAIPGSLSSAAVWSISRVDTTVNPITTILYAGGSVLFINIWNNRASLTYS